MKSRGLFKLVVDKRNNTYFTYRRRKADLNEETRWERSWFTQRNLDVAPRNINIFSSDITSQDDVLLAFLALLLILIVEGLASTILLRTRNGTLSTFRFSVKYVTQLIRDFDIPPLLKGRRKRNFHRKKLNVKLLVVALVAFSVKLGIEIAIIFLSSSSFTDVWNDQVSFRIQVPVRPKWHRVYFYTRATMDKPCESFTIGGVEQGSTSITACVTTTAVDYISKSFEKPDDVDVAIISDVHWYGAEHYFSIGGVSANYSTRAMFALNDEKPRLMAQMSRSHLEGNGVKLTHLNLLAFWFSFYRLSTMDETVNLELLNALKPKFTNSSGPKIEVVRTGGMSYRYDSTRYITTATGMMPRGSMALRVAHQLFRSSAVVMVANATQTDTKADLFLSEGIDSKRSIVWREHSRSLNTVLLGVLTLVFLVALVALRLSMSSTSVTEISAKFWDEDSRFLAIDSRHNGCRNPEHWCGEWKKKQFDVSQCYLPGYVHHCENEHCEYDCSSQGYNNYRKCILENPRRWRRNWLPREPVGSYKYGAECEDACQNENAEYCDDLSRVDAGHEDSSSELDSKNYYDNEKH